MEVFDPREPVNAWTHGLWLALSVPTTLVLVWRARGGIGKRISLIIFGLGMACCFLGSATFHSVHCGHEALEVFNRLDHCGIFALIAGTYTPIAWNLLEGRWRWGILVPIWAMAITGSCLLWTRGSFTVQQATTWYLAMGWASVACLRELQRKMPPGALRPLVLGGVLYSAGAACNVAHWPVLWPGVVQSHEVFHVFVMAASLAHVRFMMDVVVPESPWDRLLSPATSASRDWPWWADRSSTAVRTRRAA